MKLSPKRNITVGLDSTPLLTRPAPAQLHPALKEFLAIPIPGWWQENHKNGFPPQRGPALTVDR